MAFYLDSNVTVMASTRLWMPQPSLDANKSDSKHILFVNAACVPHCRAERRTNAEEPAQQLPPSAFFPLYILYPGRNRRDSHNIVLD